MSQNVNFSEAIKFLESGEVPRLTALLRSHPGLATATDDSNATLLVRLIDWPGNRPNAAESAIALLDAGAGVDARRNEGNGTPLSGALCTEEVSVIRVLLAGGADVHAPCGWQSGSVLEQADRLCENYHRMGEAKIQEIAELFSEAAGRPVPQRTPIGSPVPLLFVNNFEKGLKYYTEKLGFRLEWLLDDDPDDPYGSIVRGNTNFHLTVCKCDGNVHVGRLYTRIPAADVDALHAELEEHGVRILCGPKDQLWGLREFEIQDPDGNRFEFFQFIES